MNRLIDIGFQKVGSWFLYKDHELVFRLTDMFNDKNIIYAFTSDNDIKYIGKTTQTLSRRMVGYQRPGRTQTTNIKNHAFIKDLLNKGKVLDIFALRDNGLFHYGIYHINLAAGLEDGLIASLKPEWNGLPTVSLPNKTKKSIVQELTSKSGSNYNTVDVIPSNEVNDSGSNIVTEGCLPFFVLTLRKTYFDAGFFNVGIKHARDRKSVV